jgi:hypothetical protein
MPSRGQAVTIGSRRPRSLLVMLPRHGHADAPVGTLRGFVQSSRHHDCRPNTLFEIIFAERPSGYFHVEQLLQWQQS